jgi:hypothetical protein
MNANKSTSARPVRAPMYLPQYNERFCLPHSVCYENLRSTVTIILLICIWESVLHSCLRIDRLTHSQAPCRVPSSMTHSNPTADASLLNHTVVTTFILISFRYLTTARPIRSLFPLPSFLGQSRHKTDWRIGCP